ncbi:MAG: hypothetical protein ACI87E_003931 [Mariniblastus sp.]|jgi:hypothetical protein
MLLIPSPAVLADLHIVLDGLTALVARTHGILELEKEARRMRQQRHDSGWVLKSRPSFGFVFVVQPLGCQDHGDDFFDSANFCLGSLGF